MYKLNMRHITLFTILFIMLSLVGCTNDLNTNQPKATKGILDLTQWSVNEEIIELNGEWEFYHNQFIEPEELVESNKESDGYANIPSSWNNYISMDKKSSGEGYATYRLIFLAQDNNDLATKLPRIHTAYKLWINGELIRTVGRIGKMCLY